MQRLGHRHPIRRLGGSETVTYQMSLLSHLRVWGEDMLHLRVGFDHVCTLDRERSADTVTLCCAVNIDSTVDLVSVVIEREREQYLHLFTR